MTRARAVELLNKFKFCCNFYECTNEWECEECVEALYMAIEELEKETVLRETYDHEFNLRKMFEMKVFELEKKIAEQESIIYCKECKHWHEWENGTGSCHRSNSIWIGTDFDDYCSFAERKEQ